MRPGRFGAGQPCVALQSLTIGYAWNLQGTMAAHDAQRYFGIALPHTANTMTSNDSLTALWIGPGSWLLVSGAAPHVDFERARDAMNVAGGALFDVSASRIAYLLRGPRAVDVLAAGCPLDFHPRVFGPGICAQSVFARVNVLVCQPVDSVFVVLAAGSFARDVLHGVCSAAAEIGYEVLPERAWGSLS
ncbi:MAG TPA: sarcosine oxidase subunit gamma family protein [Casimicrobiaceae bacterium]|nr:sarcosine oxidase subunit gamma family protein [Casimicrobiaceae bacterium]